MISEEPKTIHSTKENYLKILVGNMRNLRDCYITSKIKAEATMRGTIREQKNILQN